MIDTLNMVLDGHKVEGINLLSTIPQYLDVGSISEHLYGGMYPVISGRLGNLKVSVSNWNVQVKDGSFSKWFLGDNFQTMTRKDIQRGFECISDTLHLPLETARVERLDIAQNLIMQHPVEIYLPHLGEMKNAKRLEQPTGLYYTGTNTQLVFYDKIKEQRKHNEEIPELFANRNVLRYEHRNIHRLPQAFQVPEVIGALLYDEQFYIKMIMQWLNSYQSIDKLHNFIFNFDNMKTKKDLYLQGILSLVEQQGGQLVFLEQIKNAAKKGELSAKQAHDLRDAIKSAYNVSTGGVRPNDDINELTKKIADATKFFR